MKKYLLVDDNDFSLSLTENLIREAESDEDIEIILAKDGETAIKIFQDSKPNEISAIFMDIVMPEKTGITTLHEIRSMERDDAKTMPIIIVSAIAEGNSIIGIQEKNLMTDYIQKPLSVVDLKKILKKIQ